MKLTYVENERVHIYNVSLAVFFLSILFLKGFDIISVSWGWAFVIALGSIVAFCLGFVVLAHLCGERDLVIRNFKVVPSSQVRKRRRI